MFDAEDISPTPIGGPNPTLDYRRVHLAGVDYDGLVSHEPELEQLVPDIRAYIAKHLARQEAKMGRHGLTGRLYSAVYIPLPDR